MRMFVAVRPPREALDDLDEFLEPRRAVDAARALCWTVPEQWHLTLAFLPAVREDQLDALTDQLAEGAARARPFELCLRGGGAFPDAADARVLWMGVSDEATAPLRSLARLSRNSAGVSGIPVEGKHFHPHLTVARLRRPTEVTRWIRVLDTYRSPAWTADRVVVVESHPGPRGRTGARHEVRATVPLGGATR